MNNQVSFMMLGIKKKLRAEKFLEEMDAVTPWHQLIAAIRKCKEKSKKQETGRKPYEIKLMLQIYFLQQWYNLSDPAMEDAIYDRLSFQKFLGIDLLGDNVPDETSILRFRHFLEEHKLQKEFMKIIKKKLQKSGLMLKTGTIVDATIFHAPSSTKNKDKKRDPEMRSTKKGANFHFGAKGHIGVDGKHGLVHTLEFTAANVSDKKMMDKLLHGEEEYICGDKGYYDQSMKRDMRAEGVVCLVLDKNTGKRKLSSSQKKMNGKKTRLRGKVEFPFNVVKNLWGHAKLRYKGLFKNEMQMNALFSLANLYMARRKLLALQG